MHGIQSEDIKVTRRPREGNPEKQKTLGKNHSSREQKCLQGFPKQLRGEQRG